MNPVRYIVGTSGYSFADWVGPYYPPGTRAAEMFDLYARQFEAVELNFTFYRMPVPRTLEALARRSPPGFEFWVKANRAITHGQEAPAAREFLENLYPLADADKLAGVLFQFPQSFHRTVANRRYLAGVLESFQAVPAAVEFRHASWDCPATLQHLRQRSVSVVVPDVPDLPGLFRPAPVVTSATGYLRLHSRRAQNWYGRGGDRYDYDYTQAELAEVARRWSGLAKPPERVYAFFNNCHRGQAARNAEAFRRILQRISP